MRGGGRANAREAGVAEMRVDKFLQVSRLVRRRVLAQRLCDAGHVRVNDRRARAGTAVGPGDVLDLALGPRRLVVRVRRLPATPREADGAYEVVREVTDEGWWG